MADGSDIVERLKLLERKGYGPGDFMGTCRDAALEITRLRAQAPGWRGMGSAPKDGTRIILAWGGKSIVGWWLDNSKTSHPWQGWRVASMETWPTAQPSAWQPLPSPPAEGGK